MDGKREDVRICLTFLLGVMGLEGRVGWYVGSENWVLAALGGGLE